MFAVLNLGIGGDGGAFASWRFLRLQQQQIVSKEMRNIGASPWAAETPHIDSLWDRLLETDNLVYTSYALLISTAFLSFVFVNVSVFTYATHWVDNLDQPHITYYIQLYCLFFIENRSNWNKVLGQHTSSISS